MDSMGVVEGSKDPYGLLLKSSLRYRWRGFLVLTPGGALESYNSKPKNEAGKGALPLEQENNQKIRPPIGIQYCTRRA